MRRPAVSKGGSGGEAPQTYFFTPSLGRGQGVGQERNPHYRATSAAKRLNVGGETPKMDLGTSPGTRRPLDLNFTLASRRSTSKFKANNDRPSNADARLAGTLPNVIDVGGSYSLRRNFDVTAGIRYKSQDRDRLAPLPDAQRDSQAVYVGTAFRF